MGAELGLYWIMDLLARSDNAKQRVWMGQYMDYGYQTPDITIAILLGLVFCVIAPLITPVAFLFFVATSELFKYQLLYVFSQQFESGGLVGPRHSWTPPCFNALPPAPPTFLDSSLLLHSPLLHPPFWTPPPAPPTFLDTSPFWDFTPGAPFGTLPCKANRICEVFQSLTHLSLGLLTRFDRDGHLEQSFLCLRPRRHVTPCLLLL